MKRILSVLLLLLSCTAAGARVPLESELRARIESPDSAQYYPALMARYRAADTTLTADDYHCLYYGYAYQPEYRPLDTDPALDRFFAAIGELNVDVPDPANLAEILAAGEATLERDPFSPQVLNLMAFAHSLLRNDDKAQQYFTRMNRVLQTIADSGDGLTEKSPRHILMFSHAFDLLGSENLPYGDSRIVSRTVEYIPLRHKTDGVKGYYFDYSRIYSKKPETPYKRPRTWRFNNLKIRKW